MLNPGLGALGTFYGCIPKACGQERAPQVRCYAQVSCYQVLGLWPDLDVPLQRAEVVRGVEWLLPWHPTCSASLWGPTAADGPGVRRPAAVQRSWCWQEPAARAV